MLTVILGLLVLGVLVVFHEYGHFWVGRKLGIRVERFSVGFGPVILSKKHNGVEYAVSALPLGGYVKFGGDDPRDRSALRDGDFFAVSWWRRVLTALAGPGANFLLAIVLSVILLWTGVRVPDIPNTVGGLEAGSPAVMAGFVEGDRLVRLDGEPLTSIMQGLGGLDPDRSEPVVFGVERNGQEVEVVVPPGDIAPVVGSLDFPVPAVVGEVVIGTPAYKAGLVVGDRVTAIDGAPITRFQELVDMVSASPGQEVVLTVLREGREVQIPITPFPDSSGEETVGRIGIARAAPDSYVIRLGFLEGLVQGTKSSVMMVGAMFKGIGSLFSSASNLSQIAGPVAIIQASGDAAQAGWDRLLDRAILFSIALMVFNLLPIPILDGGMVILSLVEGIRRRPMGDTGLNVYQGIGMAVMGTLLIFVLINDPVRIFQRRAALGRAGDVVP